MPKQATYINEHLFLQELMEQLSKLRGIHVEDAFGDNGIDVLVVDPHTGKRIAIECRSAAWSPKEAASRRAATSHRRAERHLTKNGSSTEKRQSKSTLTDNFRPSPTSARVGRATDRSIFGVFWRLR